MSERNIYFIPYYTKENDKRRYFFNEVKRGNKEIYTDVEFFYNISGFVSRRVSGHLSRSRKVLLINSRIYFSNYFLSSDILLTPVNKYY